MRAVLIATLYYLCACAYSPADANNLCKFPSGAVDKRLHLSAEDQDQICRLVREAGNLPIISVELRQPQNVIVVTCGKKSVILGGQGIAYQVKKSGDKWGITYSYQWAIVLEAFGQIGDADYDRLAEFAKKTGFELKPEMERVYKKDEDALGRLFKFSLAFKALDANARAYGGIVYSSLVNLSEVIGVDAYVKVIDHQSPQVQQRVRDFLYYPLLRLPKEERDKAQEENSRMYPTLFPKGFQFAHDDPVFADQT